MKDLVAEPLARLLRKLGSDKSRRAYSDDWARFRAWLKAEKVDVLAVKPRHIEDHINHLQEDGCKRSTCGRALSVIREIYGSLVRDEVIETNPAREVKNPKFDSTPKTPHLTEEQMQKLLDQRGDSWKERRDHLIVCLLFGLGWRRSEVAQMQVEDFRDGTVTGLVKGKKQLTVGVPAWLQTKVEEWAAYAGLEDGPLLPRGPGDETEISGDIVYEVIKQLSTRIGFRVSPHGLRRTNITLGGKRGVSLKERQLAVGHSSQATTERYDRARDAAEHAPGQVFADLVEKKKD